MFKKFITILIILFGIMHIAPVLAQTTDALTMTITPPLIKMNMIPGESWTSVVKIVNNNTQPLTVYASAVDFKSGENGGVVFMPETKKEDLTDEAERVLLSHWMSVASGPIEIPAQESADIPFTIRVPEKAEPGGHYAAILIGTRPGKKTKGTAIKISSQLASLILLNIGGKIVEKGQISEFSTGEKFYDDPNVNFTVRFENTGNVHLQPQGEIIIYDMFDNRKDGITINHASDFGNVLPNSTRKWNFSWSGERGIGGMGRYRASLVLTYGEQARETVNWELYFWVIDTKLVSWILGIVLALILLIAGTIRVYIRRAVMATQKAAGIAARAGGSQPVAGRRVYIRDTNTPLKGGRKTGGRTPRIGWTFFNRSIIAIIVVLAAVGAIIAWQSRQELLPGKGIAPPAEQPAAGTEDKPQESRESSEDSRPDGMPPASDSEFAEDGDAATSSSQTDTNEEDVSKEEDIPKEVADDIDKTGYSIKVLNGSGISGAAGRVESLLKEDGFEAISLGNADSFSYKNILIKHTSDSTRIAEMISALFQNIVELQEVESQEEDVIVIVGSNFQ